MQPKTKIHEAHRTDSLRLGKQGPTLVVLLEDLEAMDAVILSQILVALR